MKKVINIDCVIAGLRFVAENRGLDEFELADGLKKLGCDWTHDDWGAYFGKLPAVNIFDSMRLCAIATAAKIIVNMNSRDPFMRSWCDDRFLSADNDESIYHFVRIMTGDESFTKENIDQRNNG